MFKSLNENKDLIIVAIASFFIGFGVASFFGGASPDAGVLGGASDKEGKIAPLVLPGASMDQNKDGKGLGKIEGKETLMAENQRAGSVVTIHHAQLAEPRWLVVREVNDGGTSGNILGAGWFPAGAHDDISIELLRGTVGGEQYIVELYADTNADKKFDKAVDKTVIGADGATVTAKFSTIASSAGN